MTTLTPTTQTPAEKAGALLTETRCEKNLRPHHLAALLGMSNGELSKAELGRLSLEEIQFITRRVQAL